MLLKAKEPAKAVAELQEENKRLQKEIERLVQVQADHLRGSLREKIETVNGLHLIAAVLPLHDPNAVKNLAFELEREFAPAVVAFGSVQNDKPLLTVRISEALVQERSLHAGTIARELAQKFLQGGGGGQAFFATAGGADAARLHEAVDGIRNYI
jgi:alanyl-tRNA synthetase